MRSSNFLAAFSLAALALALLSCARTPSYPEATATDGEIRFAIETLTEDKPALFSFHHEGRRINYFVLKINGRVESYFDACAKCSPKKLGYRVSGGRLVCAACGQRYRMDDLGGIGSCYPLRLEGRVEGASYVIEKDDIVKGARYF